MTRLEELKAKKLINSNSNNSSITTTTQNTTRLEQYKQSKINNNAISSNNNISNNKNIAQDLIQKANQINTSFQNNLKNINDSNSSLLSNTNQNNLLNVENNNLKFNTIEEAQEYAKQNNIKVSNNINKIPDLISNAKTMPTVKQVLGDDERNNVYPKLTNREVNLLTDMNTKLFGKNGSNDTKENFIEDYNILAYGLRENKNSKGTWSDKANKFYYEMPSIYQYYNDVLKREEELNKGLQGIVRNVGRNTEQLFKNASSGTAVGITNIYDTIKNIPNRPRNNIVNNINIEDLIKYDSNYPNMTLGERIKNNQQSAAVALNQLDLIKGDSEELNNLYEQIKNGTYKGTVEDISKVIEEAETEKANKDRQSTKWARNLQAEVQKENNERYKGAWRAIMNATNVVANQLPVMGANIIVPGTGTAALYGNAYGGAYNEALDEGASSKQAMDYATLNAMAETGTEALSAGVSQGLTGIPGLSKITNLTEKITNPIIRTGANLIGDVIGEGSEEMITASLDPLFKKITYDPNAGFESINDYMNTINEAFTSSILPTLMMGGVGIAINGTEAVAERKIDAINKSNLTDVEKQQLINNVEEDTQKTISNIQNSNPQELNNSQYSLNNQENMSSVRRSANSIQETSGFKIPENTISTLETVQNKRPGLTIEFDENIQGNGIYTLNEDGTRSIKINPNSNRAIEFTLMHELGHDLKTGDTDSYTELQNFVIDFAKTKEGFEIAKNALGETYAKQLGDGNFNLNDEATNDILGETIGNQEFLNSLAQKKPNVFQRIYNWFKNVLFDGKNTGKTFEERRFLNSLEGKFKTAYDMAFNNQKNNLNNQYSIQEREDGSKYIKVDTDQDIFKGIDEKDYSKIAKMYMQDYLQGNTVLSANDIVNVGYKGIGKYTNPQQKTRYFNEKMQLTPELKNALEIAEKVSEGMPLKENTKYPNWEYYKINFELNGKNFEGLINIGIDKDGNKHFYEINKIHTTRNSVCFNTTKK